MRFIRFCLALLGIVVLDSLVVPAALSAQVADTVAVVWPTTFTLKGFVLANQALVATAIVSGILFALSRWVKGFAQLHDWLTRVVQLLVGVALSYGIMRWGGTPDPLLKSFVTGFLSFIVGSGIFLAGRTQPGNHS